LTEYEQKWEQLIEPSELDFHQPSEGVTKTYHLFHIWLFTTLSDLGPVVRFLAPVSSMAIHNAFEYGAGSSFFSTGFISGYTSHRHKLRCLILTAN
jgi:hypothetical protein